MMGRSTAFGILIALMVLAAGRACVASSPVSYDPAALADAFQGAQKVDLRTSKVPSVVKLRDIVKISPPTEPVILKTFKRDSLPAVLQPAFQDPGVAGVTIGGKYIAIIHTELDKEYDDILSHEMVHAYISLASPKPLPFWFQEGSAVHFFTDKTRKFYGQPSKDQIGVMVGKTVELNDAYKQKLQSFHFLIEQAGDQKFNAWFRDAVITGVVNPRPLMGLSETTSEPRHSIRRFPQWLIGVIAGVVVLVLVVGYHVARRDDGYI
ncbi:MAG: hypothetical protein ACYC64_12925 [Armatimonadota bacterium]